MILVDDREPKYFSRVFEQHNHPFEVVRLPVGDFIAGDFVVERKDANDFVNSVIYGRIYEQLRALKKYVNENEGIEYPLLIVEGSIPAVLKFRKKISQSQLAGMLTSVAKWNVPVLPSPNMTFTALILISMDRKTKHYRRVAPKKSFSSMTDRERALHVLQAFEGVGEKKAEVLLNHFGTLLEVFNSSMTELQRLTDKTTGKKMYELLRKKF